MPLRLSSLRRRRGQEHRDVLGVFWGLSPHGPEYPCFCEVFAGFQGFPASPHLARFPSGLCTVVHDGAPKRRLLGKRVASDSSLRRRTQCSSVSAPHRFPSFVSGARIIRPRDLKRANRRPCFPAKRRAGRPVAGPKRLTRQRMSALLPPLHALRKGASERIAGLAIGSHGQTRLIVHRGNGGWRATLAVEAVPDAARGIMRWRRRGRAAFARGSTRPFV